MFRINFMFILLFISIMVTKKVKIASTDKPSLILTLLTNKKGGSFRMMDKASITNPDEQSVFEIDGVKTAINNKDVSVCGTLFGSGVSSCSRWLSKATVFEILDVGGNVKFKTDSRCLTRGLYDTNTNGYYLVLDPCTNIPEQLFSTSDETESKEKKPSTPEPSPPKSDPTTNPDTTKESSPKNVSGGSSSSSRSAVSAFSQQIMDGLVKSMGEGKIKNPHEFNEHASKIICEKQSDNIRLQQQTQKMCSPPIALLSPKSSMFTGKFSRPVLSLTSVNN